MAAVSSIAGVHRTPTKAVMSRSGTDSPYRPTPNQEAKELTSRSPTASPTRCVFVSLGVVREELYSPTDEDLLGMLGAFIEQYLLAMTDMGTRGY